VEFHILPAPRTRWRAAGRAIIRIAARRVNPESPVRRRAPILIQGGLKRIEEIGVSSQRRCLPSRRSSPLPGDQ
jgi:hypothetical protein